MSSFQNLFNEQNGTFDNLTVDGTIDLSNAILTGLPVDNVTIQFTSNVLSVKNAGISNLQLALNSVQDGNIVSTKLAGTIVIPVNNSLTQSTVVEIANGTALAPSLSFISDPTTGFFKFGSPGVALSVGGSNNFTWNASGFGSQVGDIYSQNRFISGTNGTDGAPSFCFSNDSTSGFYLSGTHEIGICSNGSLIAKFNSSGIIAFTGSVYSQNSFIFQMAEQFLYRAILGQVILILVFIIVRLMKYQLVQMVFK